ncbi:hypothetical protein OG948_51515 (plasmid) [Embleya sp. NBC_00888]|uniref:hypothetical protein n=1 Tax=Embleya sp. NBC_00888 TaxID=2975960 RepID=UPI002F912E1A|nr:hypothetical protein OG948_51515 [Embleya sp. NBC_00888]
MTTVTRAESTSARSAAPAPGRRLEELDWWRSCTVRVIDPAPELSDVTRSFLHDLAAAFERGGHRVIPPGESETRFDVVLVGVSVPEGPEPLADRIVEEQTPLMLKLRKEQGRQGTVGRLVAVAEVPERLSEMSHPEVVRAARILMARVGVFTVVFITPGAVPGEVAEATLCTMEGGHPTETEKVAQGICDRLVSAACAHEVAGRHDVVPNAITADAWAAARAPRSLAVAGTRMGDLGLLPAPHAMRDFVSPRLSRTYAMYLNLQGFSEGMLFAFDPDLNALVVTASGRWGVDKRDLSDTDLVAVDHRLNRGRLRVLAPEGAQPMAPSVEAWEVCALFEAAPTVRVGRNAAGHWQWDPNGTHEVPAIRAGLHAHVGISHADPALIETIPPDREHYPYGFGCGTDLMIDVARSTLAASRALHDPADTRHYVRWPMLYHGEMALELWGPGQPDEPLRGLLDLFDPNGLGAVHFHPDHIDQPC